MSDWAKVYFQMSHSFHDLELTRDLLLGLSLKSDGLFSSRGVFPELDVSIGNVVLQYGSPATKRTDDVLMNFSKCLF